MNTFFGILFLILASMAFAHPNGSYKIDNRSDVLVTFEVIGRCAAGDDALSGSLRTLTFSSKAEDAPYLFKSGYYVEVHSTDGEEYIQTDDSCRPKQPRQAIPATRRTFGDYSLARLR